MALTARAWQLGDQKPLQQAIGSFSDGALPTLVTEMVSQPSALFRGVQRPVYPPSHHLPYNPVVNSEAAMNRQAEAIKQEMEGLIALLLSLAVLAERACRAPFSVRARVLSLLWPAEQAARAHVFSSANFLVAPMGAHEDDLVADAAGLAARFRCLAFVLAGVLVRLLRGWRACDPVPLGDAFNAAGVMSAGGSARRSQPPFDTS